mmetsp:Transcript_39423/g.82921  ORF Transcript_39423/g.82921 Transcript_39423/m.82921 type:complete len:745 (+) Transcript_39423:77-2311(+)
MKLFAGAVAIALSARFGVVSANESSGDDGCFPDNSPFHPDDWTYCQEITDTLRMYYTPLEDTIMMGLHATEGVFGWSSLAPSGNGGMKGAAQIVVRKDDSEEWIAEDRYSFDKVTPSMDEQQDVQLLFAQQDEDTGETSWGVVIPQDSCDEPYDYAIENKDIMMLWAFGASHSFTFHEGRGQFMANLMNLPPVKPDLKKYDHIDLLMDNVSVVRGEPELDPTNPFICTYFDLQELGRESGFTQDDKIQMVGYEPNIQEGNEEYIHHLTLFTCEGFTDASGGSTGLDDSHLEHNLVIPACTNMPPGCGGLFVAWAIGQDPPIYPENVGFPIGEGQRWLVMQMHYFNPKLDEGVYDSSGLSLYYTLDPRPVDAGLMSFTSAAVTGQQPPLPGGMKDVATETMYIEPDCTQGWTEPLTVMSVFHHSHFMGLKQEIIVERDGKNLGPMRTEYKYDYNHQGTLMPNNALNKLMPGDRMAATCHFDTSSVSSDSVVEIGEESNKEMCFQAVFYYPKQTAATSFSYGDAKGTFPYIVGDLESCSKPPTEEVFGSLCEEELFNDVPGFYNLLFTNIYGYDGAPFSMPEMCNGGDITADIRALLPICPDDGCTETQSCSDELIRGWAQGVCAYNCNQIGVTLYPDVSDTTPFDSLTWGCPNFNRPASLAERKACKVKGSLPQEIELIGIPPSDSEDIIPDAEPDDTDPGDAEPDNTDPGISDPDNTKPDSSGVKASSPLNTFAFILMLGLLHA